MENAFNKIGDGKLLGLENKLKTQNSLVDKLVREAIDLKSLADPLARAGSDVKDAVRYSAIFDADNFTSNAKKFMSELEQAGWERIKLKNTFKAGENFKGINTAWRNKSGDAVEIQLHTERGYYTNKQTHDMYVKSRHPNTPQAEKSMLNIQIRGLSEAIELPDGVETIK